MHDARQLLQMGSQAVEALARRGYDLDLARLDAVLTRRNEAIRRIDELRSEAKSLARRGQRAVTPGGSDGQGVDDSARQRARDIKALVHTLEQERDAAADELHAHLLDIPNLPSPLAPDGASEDHAVEVSRHGETPELPDEPADHVEIGERLGILDFARATALSGPRFAVVTGPGAALERALATFFLETHTREHGYVEQSVPFLVTPQTMTGTGQLPKFAADLFATSVGDRELYLVPTAEVPVTNLHAGEILDGGRLPLAYTAFTPCFRSEAGSYGRDTRGLIRLHQFSKVELVRFCRPEDALDQLDVLVQHAGACLRALGLPYRTMTLAAGDTGFAAELTYDLEVWFPSQGRYREISSCSTFGTFQARRAGMRYRDAEGRRQHVATLNGSALPIGRTLAAILENFQEPDGSVTVPEVLVPYLGFTSIGPDGETVSRKPL